MLDVRIVPAPQPQPERQPVSEPRPCTCHPDDNPPIPCAQKYALSECMPEPTEAQIEQERSEQGEGHERL